jgi:hypothetical protein
MRNPVEELASKAMGAMKVGEVPLEGLTGTFKQLAQEHGEVSALLMRVKGSSDPQVRAELFPTIRSTLLSHEKGEVMVLYPVTRQYRRPSSSPDKYDQEASELQKVLASVSQTEYQDPKWDDQFDALVVWSGVTSRRTRTTSSPNGEKCWEKARRSSRPSSNKSRNQS